MGEHLLCKQGVIGSNPFISTNYFLCEKIVCGSFFEEKRLREQETNRILRELEVGYQKLKDRFLVSGF